MNDSTSLMPKMRQQWASPDTTTFHEPQSSAPEVLSPPDQVEAVEQAYAFSLDDANSFLDPQDNPLQLAMRLTRRACPAESLTVICKADGDDLLWFVTDMSCAPFEAGAYIAAVERRVERQRAQRLSFR